MTLNQTELGNVNATWITLDQWQCPTIWLSGASSEKNVVMNSIHRSVIYLPFHYFHLEVCTGTSGGNKDVLDLRSVCPSNIGMLSPGMSLLTNNCLNIITQRNWGDSDSPLQVGAVFTLLSIQIHVGSVFCQPYTPFTLALLIRSETGFALLRAFTLDTNYSGSTI